MDKQHTKNPTGLWGEREWVSSTPKTLQVFWGKREWVSTDKKLQSPGCSGLCLVLPTCSQSKERRETFLDLGSWS